MKGYSETRGQAFKLDYDAESKQFVSKSIAHEFAPNVGLEDVFPTLAELRRRQRKIKAKRQLMRILDGMSPETRDDVGMTEVFAAAQ